MQVEPNTSLNSLNSAHSLRLTAAAIDYFRRKMDVDKTAKGIRFSIKKGGCSGSSYDIQMATAFLENDIVIEQEGIRLFIDSQSFPFLQNMQVDCIKDDFSEYLKFQNPNAKGECGCGESIAFE